RPIVKVGLVIGPLTPRRRQAPRTNVVFPAPISPETRITSPGRRSAAARAPIASVSSGPAVSNRSGSEPLIGGAQAQADAEQEERDPGQPEDARVRSRVGQRRRPGGGASRRPGVGLM